MEISILEKQWRMRVSATDRLSYYFLATPSGGAVTSRSHKSVNNNMDFLILRLTEIARIQKWLDIDFSHKDKGLCCQTDQMCVVVKTQGKLKWREEKQPVQSQRQRRHRLVSTMTCTVRPNHENDRQQPPDFSSLVLHTYTYTML